MRVGPAVCVKCIVLRVSTNRVERGRWCTVDAPCRLVTWQNFGSRKQNLRREGSFKDAFSRTNCQHELISQMGAWPSFVWFDPMRNVFATLNRCRRLALLSTGTIFPFFFPPVVLSIWMAIIWVATAALSLISFDVMIILVLFLGKKINHVFLVVLEHGLV